MDIAVDGSNRLWFTERGSNKIGRAKLTGQVTGEVQTDRLTIEDGALLRGRVEAGKQPTKTAEIKASAATASAAPSATASTGKVADTASLSPGTAAN